MKHPIAFSIWVLLALLSFLCAYSGKLIYDLDGSFLCIHENELYGKLSSTHMVPTSEISKFDIKITPKRRGKSCRLPVIGNAGQCLGSDVPSQDASRFQVWLQRALRKHPAGTFHVEQTATLKGFAITGKWHEDT